MSAHTPGPWTAEIGRHVASIRAGSVHQKLIADVFIPLNEEERVGNARLIAAAPELLEALTLLRDLGENVPIFQLDGGKSSVKAVRLAGKFTGAMDKARAALVKARGE